MQKWLGEKYGAAFKLKNEIKRKIEAVTDKIIMCGNMNNILNVFVENTLN